MEKTMDKIVALAKASSDFSALRPAIQPLPYNGRNPFLPNAENTTVQENQKMKPRLSGFRTCKAFMRTRKGANQLWKRRWTKL